ncbi:tail fiber assembly protein [Shewanella sp.]|uniref:tail fiber assembly protein n=1 Tax=Shewanella sp. TaxID=50422 RepID=UPI001B761553|nr:tail fiber assembly protein [Shewanella sp.]MBP6518675.1 tail fiber assembly protein [Shewanella sp.]
MKNYKLDIEQAEIGINGLASKAGWIKTYIADPATREYVNASMENIYFDVSVSAGAYIDAPELPTKAGFAVVRSKDETKWEIVADHRTKTAYSTETRQPTEINFIGDLPPTLTLLEPKTEFDFWEKNKWLTDAGAQQESFIVIAESEKSQLLQEANSTITYLQDSIDVGLDDDNYELKLKDWKKYRVLLNRVDTSTAPDIEWPVKP